MVFYKIKVHLIKQDFVSLLSAWQCATYQGILKCDPSSSKVESDRAENSSQSEVQEESPGSIQGGLQDKNYTLFAFFMLSLSQM